MPYIKDEVLTAKPNHVVTIAHDPWFAYRRWREDTIRKILTETYTNA